MVNKVGVIIFSIIVIVPLFFAVPLVYAQQNETSPNSNLTYITYDAPVTEVTLEIPQNATFKDKENRFHLYDSLGIYYLLNQDDLVSLYISASIPVYERSVKQQGLEQFAYDVAYSESEDKMLIEDVDMTKYSIDGHPSATFLYSWYVFDEPTIVREILVNQDNHIWRLYFQAPQSVFDLPVVQEIKNRMFESIHFTK